VCKLNSSLYGLKQAPRQLYLKFDLFMVEHNFSRCDPTCVYYKSFDNGEFVLLLLYVDDMLVTWSSKAEINKLKQ